MIKWISALAAALILLTLATEAEARQRRHRHVRHHVTTVAKIPLPRPRVMACIDRPPRHFSTARLWTRLGLEPEPALNITLDNAIALDDATRYLVRTATPGATLTRQGADIGIGRLHPVFRLRLAAAIKQARAEGIPVCVYSAYRPPAFGIGGFHDKAMSMHAYGLAVDVCGIGRPGSKTARRWFLIAGANKIYNPYGPFHGREWNHFQPTFSTAVARRMELRSTITAQAPKDLDRMWRVALPLISERIVLVEPPRRRHVRRHHARARYARQSPAPRALRVSFMVHHGA